jgi:hypothetical protein
MLPTSFLITTAPNQIVTHHIYLICVPVREQFESERVVRFSRVVIPNDISVAVGEKRRRAGVGHGYHFYPGFSLELTEGRTEFGRVTLSVGKAMQDGVPGSAPGSGLVVKVVSAQVTVSALLLTQCANERIR